VTTTIEQSVAEGEVLMLEYTDLYALLGVPATASPAEIRHGYRTALRRYHPDTRMPGSPDQSSEDRALHQVLAAYAVLNDPVRRADYDRRRLTSPSPPGPLAPRPPVVVLGDTGSTWPDRTGITPLQAWSAPGPRQWLLELLRELGYP
jgi:curved DNA-binding protein CbpA